MSTETETAELVKELLRGIDSYGDGGIVGTPAGTIRRATTLITAQQERISSLEAAGALVVQNFIDEIEGLRHQRKTAEAKLSSLEAAKAQQGKGGVELQKCIDVIQSRIDYHDQNEAMADACDMPGSAKWHENVRKELRDNVLPFIKQGEGNG